MGVDLEAAEKLAIAYSDERHPCGDELIAQTIRDLVVEVRKYRSLSNGLLAELGRVEGERDKNASEVARFADEVIALRGKLAVAVKALIFIRNELGVPQPGYPAPVANAAHRANNAIAEIGGES